MTKELEKKFDESFYSDCGRYHACNGSGDTVNYWIKDIKQFIDENFVENEEVAKLVVEQREAREKRYRQELLEKLPRKKDTSAGFGAESWNNGYNTCLEEVKKIIK